jgi:hypothetical protein
MPRRVETLLQVPPPAALVVEPGTTYTPMGMGGQSGAVEKAARPIDEIQRSFLPCPSVNLFNY